MAKVNMYRRALDLRAATQTAAQTAASESLGSRGLQTGPLKDFLGSNPGISYKGATPYSIDPAAEDWKPDTANNWLTRAQWQLYQDRYKPIEDQALGYLTDPNAAIESAATQAGDNVTRSFDAREGMTDRRLSRMGVQPTAEQRANLTRHEDLRRALTTATAKNEARTETKNTNLDLLSGALNLGAGLSSAATTNSNSAAAMANQRSIADANADAGKKGSVVSSALTGAGIGAALAPIGASTLGWAAGGSALGMALALI